MLLSQLLVVARNTCVPGLAAASLQSLPPSSPCVLSVYLRVSSLGLLTKTPPVSGFGAHSNSV